MVTYRQTKKGNCVTYTQPNVRACVVKKIQHGWCKRDEWSGRYPSFSSPPPQKKLLHMCCENSMAVIKTHHTGHGVQCGCSRKILACHVFLSPHNPRGDHDYPLWFSGTKYEKLGMRIPNVSKQKIFGILGSFHIHGTQCVITISFMLFSSQVSCNLKAKREGCW